MSEEPVNPADPPRAESDLSTRRATPEQIEALTRAATDAGRIIEVGWLAFRLAAIAPIASPGQIEDMRRAFFGGASHIFFSIMTMLDPGTEATEADLDRMDKINEELAEFLKAFKAEHGITDDPPADPR